MILAFVILAFIEAQIALVVSVIAYLRVREATKEPVVYEETEEEKLLRLDMYKARKIAEEAQIPMSRDELVNLANMVMK